MDKEIYDYLKEYGFYESDINSFERENNYLLKAKLDNIKSNIDFLVSKGLEHEEIIYVIKFNPYMLTQVESELIELDNIYKRIFSKEEIKNLINKYPEAYTIDPDNLKEVVVYLESKHLNILNIINNEPSILSRNVMEIKNLIG